MRYRKLTDDGDYSFGHGQANLWINTPDGVAQAVKTRLALLSGEWFLNTTEGTPYLQAVVGTGTQSLYDAAIQARILQTEGVSQIAEYSSQVENRHLSISATIDTIYGQTVLNYNIQGQG